MKAPQRHENVAGPSKGGRKWLKRTGLFLVMVGLLAAGFLAYRPRPLPVEVATVEYGPVVVSLLEDGRTRLQERYVVSAPVRASMERMALRPGDKVEAGAVVARLFPLSAPLLDRRSRAQAQGRVASARAQQQQAKAAVERERDRLKFLETELERKRALAQRSAIAQSALQATELERDTARRNLKAARYAAEAATHELSVAQAALSTGDGGSGGQGRDGTAEGGELELIAPIAGTVISVPRREGGLLEAGTVVLELGDRSGLEVVVDVLSADAVRVREGGQARLSGWGGADLTGHVSRVEPSGFRRVSALGIEEQRVSVVVQIDSPAEQWRGLGDGYQLDVELVTARRPRALRVPLGAVFGHGDGSAVFLAEQEHARLRSVATELRNDRWVEVRAGLEAGQGVIVFPSEQVEDGVAIVDR